MSIVEIENDFLNPLDLQQTDTDDLPEDPLGSKPSRGFSLLVREGPIFLLQFFAYPLAFYLCTSPGDL